jgi:hypothetical protein
LWQGRQPSATTFNAEKNTAALRFLARSHSAGTSVFRFKPPRHIDKRAIIDQEGAPGRRPPESLEALGFERLDFVFFPITNRKGSHPGGAQILGKDLVDTEIALGAVAEFFAFVMAGVFDLVAVSGPNLKALE